MIAVEELRVVEQEAFSEATRSDIPQLATFLQDLFGQKITALIAGVNDPKAVGQWARGERSPHHEVEMRLRTAYRIASLLLHSDSEVTVRAWFMGMNPHLEDRAPAVVLKEDPERVLRAARAFLVGA